MAVDLKSPWSWCFSVFWFSGAAVLVFSINFALGFDQPSSLSLTKARMIANGSGIRSDSYMPAKELRGRCKVNSDCRKSAYICSNMSMCDCAEGYIPDEKQIICIGAVGMECMYDNHCITGAYCKGQTICTCKLEFPVVSPDKWSCEESGSKATTVSSSRLSFCAVFLSQLLSRLFVSYKSLWHIKT